MIPQRKGTIYLAFKLNYSNYLNYLVTSCCFRRERRHDERSSEHTNCSAGQYGYIVKRRHSFESSARLNKKDSKMSDKEDLFWNHHRDTREENGSRKREGKTYKVTRLGENGCGYCLKVVENPDLTENFPLPSLTPVVE